MEVQRAFDGENLASALFVDLRKTFDQVDPDILLNSNQT